MKRIKETAGRKEGWMNERNSRKKGWMKMMKGTAGRKDEWMH